MRGGTSRTLYIWCWMTVAQTMEAAPQKKPSVMRRTAVKRIPARRMAG
jgi:hypothetical protein